MANSVHDSIRLDTALTGQLPTTEYSVALEGLSDMNYAPVVTRRGLTGFLHVHRTTSGGDPLALRDYHYELILTQAEYLTIREEIGKIMYFMPHIRDEADPTATRKVVVLETMSESRPFDPQLGYWHVIINLKDATGNTVDT